MSGLNVRKDACELDFLALGALVHRLDPGVIPFRKARSFEIHVSGGEYNVAADPVRLLRPEDRHRDRDGQLPHRRAGAGAGARDGRHAVLQVVRARWRARPEHRHRLQRPRLRRARAGGLLQPGERGRRLAQAGRFRLGEDLRPRRPLVPFGGHLRVAVGDDGAPDHRGDAGRQGRRRDHTRST